MAPKRKKGNEDEDDPTWAHCEFVFEEGKNKRLRLRCKHCKKEYWGGVSRMRKHLGKITGCDIIACPQITKEDADFFKKLVKEKEEVAKKKKMDDYFYVDDDQSSTPTPQSSSQTQKLMHGAFSKLPSKKTPQPTLNTFFKKGDRKGVCMDICRFFYANALSFNLIKSPYFRKMMESVASHGPGLKLPSYHELRVPFLLEEYQSVQKGIEKYKEEWKRTGCTLMSDGWTDGKQRSITNFLVNSPRGTVFLKSYNTSNIIHSGENMFALLDKVIDEIGEDNVVQVVTDSAASYVLAGEMLMDKRKKIFWSPCAAHCLDLILSDIGDLPIHKDTVEKAKKVTVYIYRHTWVLDLMRKSTKGKELTRAGVTRFATSYLTLRSLHECRIPLRSMFGSEEWQLSSYAKKKNGSEVEEIILGDMEFWKNIKFCLKCVIPLVKVLRLVDGDLKPAMGYIYEAMDQAKEKIAKNFINVRSRYEPIWNIIDDRWDKQLHGPLHAAGLFLNPKYQYVKRFDTPEDYEIKEDLYNVIQRMCPSLTERAKIDKQLDMFTHAEKMFGMEMAIQMRDKKQPANW